MIYNCFFSIALTNSEISNRIRKTEDVGYYSANWPAMNRAKRRMNRSQRVGQNVKSLSYRLPAGSNRFINYSLSSEWEKGVSFLVRN